MNEINKNREVDGTARVKGKNVYIKTMGCQMNVRDSEVIAGLLTTNGYQLTANPAEADVVIFNTCSVRQHAEDKVWSEIGRITKSPPHDLAQKTRQIETGWSPRPTKKIVGLVGCMAQNYKQRVFERAPAVDFVVGPADIHKIPEIIKSLTGKKGQSPAGTVPFFEARIWETDGEGRPEEIYHTGFYEDKEHAYVVISEGCSNYCSYCVVPYVRGHLRHRNAADIINEIKQAIDQGITRVTLLGQNVNAYQSGGVDFVKLIGIVDKIKGLQEFAFVTSHPKDASLTLFKAMTEAGKLKKFLHLPAQSGSDRILALMKRGYTRKIYLDLAENYRKIVRGGALTSDIIAGFPSESESDFQDTCSLVREVEFNSAYIFKYSPRPHTEAERLKDDVPREEKERRHKEILELQKGISSKLKAKSVKRKTKV